MVRRRTSSGCKRSLKTGPMTNDAGQAMRPTIGTTPHDLQIEPPMTLITTQPPVPQRTHLHRSRDGYRVFTAIAWNNGATAVDVPVVTLQPEINAMRRTTTSRPWIEGALSAEDVDVLLVWRERLMRPELQRRNTAGSAAHYVRRTAKKSPIKRYRSPIFARNETHWAAPLYWYPCFQVPTT